MKLINKVLNLLQHIETHFNTFANRADPEEAALVRAARPGSTLFAYGYTIIYYHTLVDLARYFLLYVHKREKFIYIIINNGWS